MKVHGVALTLCTDETNLWFDSDHHWWFAKKGKGWGIVLSLKIGWVYRPIKKPFTAHNPWTSGKHWFVLKFPCIGPFLSIAFNDYGFYVGLKTYELGKNKYNKWAKRHNFKGHSALAPSISLRRTRTD